MRVIKALIFSAFTLVGGHFVNRRWDRALLFFTLALAWSAGVYPFYISVMSQFWFDGSPESMANGMDIASRILGLGLALLWLVSLVVTGIDARKPRVEFIRHWTASGVVGAFLAIVGMAGLGTFQLLSTGSSQYVKVSDVEVSEPVTSSDRTWRFSSHNFYHSAGFGGFDHQAASHPAPPTGEGVLRISFSYGGEPASGVRFTMRLGGIFETAQLTTNADGYADIPLPPGTWEVNAINTEGWDSPHSNEDIVLVTGHEAAYSEGDYRSRSWFNETGVSVTVGIGDALGTIHVDLKPQIALIWPEQVDKPVSGEIVEQRIQWAPQEGIDRYLVKLTRMERNGSSISFHHVASRVVVGESQLDLMALEHVASGGSKEEYQVEVFGFDSEGRFINSTEGSYRTASFTLTDTVLVGDKERSRMTGSLSSANFARYRKDKQRLEAVELLIEDGMLDAAEALLKRVESGSRPELQKALLGYLLAKRGDCAGAERLFSEVGGDEECRCKVEIFREVCR